MKGRTSGTVAIPGGRRVSYSIRFGGLFADGRYVGDVRAESEMVVGVRYVYRSRNREIIGSCKSDSAAAKALLTQLALRGEFLGDAMEGRR